jgi:hypothetical protein
VCPFLCGPMNGTYTTRAEARASDEAHFFSVAGQLTTSVRGAESTGETE